MTNLSSRISDGQSIEEFERKLKKNRRIFRRSGIEESNGIGQVLSITSQDSEDTEKEWRRKKSGNSRWSGSNRTTGCESKTGAGAGTQGSKGRLFARRLQSHKSSTERSARCGHQVCRQGRSQINHFESVLCGADYPELLSVHPVLRHATNCFRRAKFLATNPLTTQQMSTRPPRHNKRAPRGLHSSGNGHQSRTSLISVSERTIY